MRNSVPPIIVLLHSKLCFQKSVWCSSRIFVHQCREICTGVPQAAAAWNIEMDTYSKDLGFRRVDIFSRYDVHLVHASFVFSYSSMFCCCVLPGFRRVLGTEHSITGTSRDTWPTCRSPAVLATWPRLRGCSPRRCAARSPRTRPSRGRVGRSGRPRPRTSSWGGYGALEGRHSEGRIHTENFLVSKPSSLGDIQDVSE